MNRKEVCALIREHELGNAVKERFGDNYTRVSTKNLEKVLWDFDATLVGCPCDELEEAKKSLDEEIEKVAETTTTTQIQETQEVNNPYEAACIAFVGILKDSGLLDSVLAKL